ERAVQLGDAGIESLPDGFAFRRQRRGLRDAGRKRCPRRRREQLHNRRRVATHHTRCGLPSSAAGYAVPAVFSELSQSLRRDSRLRRGEAPPLLSAKMDKRKPGRTALAWTAGSGCPYVKFP